MWFESQTLGASHKYRGVSGKEQIVVCCCDASGGSWLEVTMVSRDCTRFGPGAKFSIMARLAAGRD